MINVFVVILNWNQPDLTIECLKSLARCKGKSYKVYPIVVDNGSSDETVGKLRKFDVNLKILETGKNLGFSGGNNVGIKYAMDFGADYVLVLNNDTELHSNLITNLLKSMERGDDVGVVSPKMYFAKGYEFHEDRYKKSELGKVIWYAGGVLDWKNIYGTNRGVDEVDKGQYEKPKEIDFATGACMMVRAKALKEVGLFNEKYYLYMEDVELSERMKNREWKIMYEPKAILWHKVSQSSGIGSDLNDYFITRNRLLFGFKYAAFRTKLALVRESLRLFITGRHWQAVGVRDFYIRRFRKGSWQ